MFGVVDSEHSLNSRGKLVLNYHVLLRALPPNQLHLSNSVPCRGKKFLKACHRILETANIKFKERSIGLDQVLQVLTIE